MDKKEEAEVIKLLHRLHLEQVRKELLEYIKKNKTEIKK